MPRERIGVEGACRSGEEVPNIVSDACATTGCTELPPLREDDGPAVDLLNANGRGARVKGAEGVTGCLDFSFG